LPSAAGAVHRSTVRRPSGQSGGRGGPECLSGCLPCFGRLSAYSVASTRPVSGVRCDRPVSAMRCPRSVVQCPVWTSGVPRQCPRVPASASAVSAPVTSWSASVRRAATRSEGPGAGRPAVSANGSTVCLSQRGFESGTVWRRIGRVAQVGAGDYAPWSSSEGLGRVAEPLRAFPAGPRLTLAAAARPRPAVSAARSKLATL
jgi:hypothetical protein